MSRRLRRRLLRRPSFLPLLWIAVAVVTPAPAGPAAATVAEAESALRRGDAIAAVRIFQELLALEPDSWQVRDGLGRALRAGGDLEGAERELRRAIELSPAEPAPARELLDLLNLSPDRGRRRQGLAWLVEKGGPFPDLLLAIVRQSRKEGDFVTARAALARLQTLAPDNREAMIEEIQVARDALDYARAEAICARIIARFPTYPQAYVHRARLQRLQGKNDDAVADYRQALALAPDEPTALTRLGEILLERGELDAAAALLTRATTVAPEMYQAYYLLVRLYQKRGDTEAAERAMTEFRRLKDKLRANTRLAGGASMVDE